MGTELWGNATATSVGGFKRGLEKFLEEKAIQGYQTWWLCGTPRGSKLKYINIVFRKPSLTCWPPDIFELKPLALTMLA